MARTFFILLVFTIFGTTKVFGDSRAFVWTYEYQTMERGHAEVEHYMTLSTPDVADVHGNIKTEHQLELEIGMNERFDFAIYQIFSQSPGDALRYEGFKLRSRTRLGDLGGDLLRPIVYLEYKAGQDFLKQKFEFKPIVGMHFGTMNLAINPIFELEKNDAGTREWEFKPGYSIGFGVRTSKLVQVGVEAFGDENGNYLGPVISHGRGDLWASFGSGFAVGNLESGESEMKLRLIIGIGVAK